MTEGFVNDDLEPMIEIALVSRTYIGTDFFELGNGEVVENDVFSGRIIFDERECNVLVILSTLPDVLVGTSLLKAKTFFVDFVDRKLEIKHKEVKS